MMSEEKLDIQCIFKYLPHRYPFLLVDRILSAESGKHLQALKNVSVNEPCFTGHFPGMPVMPGVLILEALAQASGILALISEGDKYKNSNHTYLLAGIDNARFRRVVEPGDQLILDVTLDRIRLDIFKFTCLATVDGQMVCEAEIMSARRQKRV